MLFDFFPYLTYDEWIIRDFTRRVVSDFSRQRPYTLFEDFVIPERKTPDLLAAEYYGHPKFYWLPFVINNRLPSEWPLDQESFERYLNEKYGSQRYEVSVYVDETGTPVQHIFQTSFLDQDSHTVDFYLQPGQGLVNGDFTVLSGVTPKTAEEVERDLNENRRRLRMLLPQHLGAFVEDFRSKVADAYPGL